MGGYDCASTQKENEDDPSTTKHCKPHFASPAEIEEAVIGDHYLVQKINPCTQARPCMLPAAVKKFLMKTKSSLPKDS